MSNEVGDLFKATKLAMENALGEKLSYEAFAQIIGYDGKNAYGTIARIEKGERTPAGPIILRVSDLLIAASLAGQELIVIPEWSHVISVDPADDDGSSVTIERRWFPRLQAMATVQAGGLLKYMGWAHMGAIRNPYPGEEPMEMWVRFQDILPDSEMCIPYLEQAQAILARLLEEEST